ncbi:hypothetical protein BDN67DRAFT_122939 [Paxillus ammoniavirescens]|nr:hypothetical protein BDN67DRAFT_122939 [Paxillus ammoniavirescens]
MLRWAPKTTSHSTVFCSPLLGWDDGAGCAELLPFTCLIEGLLVQAIARQLINCSSTEPVAVQPPLGMACGAYMGPYMSYAGGYLTNSDATLAYKFFPFETTEQVMLQHRVRHYWRGLGICDKTNMMCFCTSIGFHGSRVDIPIPYTH